MKREKHKLTNQLKLISPNLKFCMFYKMCSPQEYIERNLAIDNKTMDHAINEEVFNKQRQLLPEKMRLQYWQIVYTP